MDYFSPQLYIQYSTIDTHIIDLYSMYCLPGIHERERGDAIEFIDRK